MPKSALRQTTRAKQSLEDEKKVAAATTDRSVVTPKTAKPVSDEEYYRVRKPGSHVVYDSAVNYINNGTHTAEQTASWLDDINKRSKTSTTYNERQSWLDLANAFNGLLYNNAQSEIQQLQQQNDALKRRKQNADNSFKSNATWLQGHGESEADYGKYSKFGDDLLKASSSFENQIANNNARVSQLQELMFQKLMSPEVRAAYEALEKNDYANLMQPKTFAGNGGDWGKVGGRNKEQDQAIVDEFRKSIGLNEAYFNREDRAVAGAKSAGYGIGSGIASAASTLGRGLDVAGDEMRYINNETHGASVNRSAEDMKEADRIAELTEGLPEESKEFYVQWHDQHQAQIDAEKERLKDPQYQFEVGESRLQELQAQEQRMLSSILSPYIKDLETQITQLESNASNYQKSGTFYSPEALAAAQDDNKSLREAKKQMQAAIDRLNAIAGGDTSLKWQIAHPETVYDAVDIFVDDWDAKSQKEIVKAKERANKTERVLLDMEKTGLEMGFDMAAGAVTGGGSLAPMFIRVFGNAAAEARRDGADLNQQIEYGLLKAGIEMATEKMFGQFDNIGYGKGIAEEFSERLVALLADSPVGRTIARGLISAGEEGLEEVMSDMLAPIADKVYKEGTWEELFNDNMANWAYDFMLGAAMGGLGFAGGITTGQNADANARLYQGEIMQDYITANQQDAEDRSRYSEAVKYGSANDVENVVSEAASRKDTRSSVTKAAAKYRSLVSEYLTTDENGDVQGFEEIPLEKRLNKEETNMLIAAGIMPRNARQLFEAPKGERVATEAERANSKAGYIARNENTKAHAYTAELANEPGNAAEEESKAIIKKANEVLDLADNKKETPKQPVKAPVENNAQNAPESKPEPKVEPSTPEENKTVKPATAPAEQRATDTTNMSEDEQRINRNNELRKSIRKQVEEAGSKETVDFKLGDKAVTWNKGTKEITIKDADGNVVEGYTDINGEPAPEKLNDKKFTTWMYDQLSERRGAEPARDRFPPKVEKKPVEVVEQTAEEQSETEKKVRAAKSADELSKMFLMGDEGTQTTLEKLYEDITGYEWSKHPQENMEELYYALHPEEVETDEEGDEEPAPPEPVKPAPKPKPEPKLKAPKKIKGAVDVGKNAAIVIAKEPLTADEIRKGNLTWDDIKKAHRDGTLSDELWKEITGTEWNTKKNAGTYQKFLSQLKKDNIILDRIANSEAEYPEGLATEIVTAIAKSGDFTKAELADLISARSDLAKQIVDAVNNKFPNDEPIMMDDFKELAQDVIKLKGVKTNVAKKPVGSRDNSLGGGGNPEQSNGTEGEKQGNDTGVAQTATLGGRGHTFLSEDGTVGKEGEKTNLLDAALDDYGVNNPDRREKIKTGRQTSLKEYIDKGMSVLKKSFIAKNRPAVAELSDFAAKHGVNAMTILGAGKTLRWQDGGYCQGDAPMFGPTLVIDRRIPAELRALANRTGDNAAHEFGHHFGGEYAFNHRGKRPDYGNGIKSVSAATDLAPDKFETYMLAMYVDKVGDSAAITADKLANGGKMPSEQRIASIKANFKAKTTKEEQLKYVLKLAGDLAGRKWKNLAFEECMMELASKGRMFTHDLKEDAFDAEAVQTAAQDWLEKFGGVPLNFFKDFAPLQEKLNAEHDAYLARMDAERAAKYKTAAAESTSDVLKEETSVKGKTPAERFENSFIKPYTETKLSQSAQTEQETTPGERASMGPLTHEAVSTAELQRAGEASLKKALNDPAIGWNGVYGYFMTKEPNALSDYGQVIADLFSSRLNAERTNRMIYEGKIFDKTLPADFERLNDMADKMFPYAAASHSSAGSKLSRGTVQPTYESVINDAKNEFIGSLKPTEIDPKSEEAAMVRTVTDHALYTKSIEDSYYDAVNADDKAAQTEALKKMADELLEVNQVRDVKKIYGDVRGKLMQNLERKMIERIVEHSPEPFETLKAMTYNSIDRMSYDFKKVGAINTMKQIRYMNMLSNVATILNNVLNNLESSTSGATAQNIGVKLAGKRAKKVMGGEDSMSLNRNYLGFFSQKNRILNDYMLTKGAESALSLYYGLDVDEGKYETGIGTARHNQNSNAAGRMLARFQLLSGLGMQTTDAMAIERAYRGMVMEIDKMDVSAERKAELKKDAMWEARRQMYHNDDGLAKTMSSLRDWMNRLAIQGKSGSIGAGDILMPFVAVPVNVATRAMKATVPGQIVGLVNYARGMRMLERRRAEYDEAEAFRKRIRDKDAKPLSAEERKRYEEIKNVREPTDAETRKYVRALGESINNGLMTVVGGLATMLGALKNFDDEDDEEVKRLAKEKGFTGLQLNLTKLLHPFRPGGWQDDDLIIGGSWLEVMALPLAAGHTITQAALDPDEGQSNLVSAANAVLASPLSTFDDFVDIVKELPGMNQAMDIWNSYESLSWSNNFEEAFKQAVGSSVAQYSANTLSSFIMPNIVSQASAGLDNTIRDVYGADSQLEVMGRMLANKTPLRFMLPEQKSSLNETRTYGSNKAMGLLNRMVLPGTGVQVWSQNELEKEYAALREAGYGGVAAKASAPKNIKVDGTKYALNAEDRKKFDDDYTRMVNEWQSELLHTPGYKDMSPEQRDAAMTDVRTLANLICEHNALERKKNQGLIGQDVNVDFKNWEAQYQNNPQALSKFLVGKYELKQFYKKNKDGQYEVTDYSGLDNYLKNSYMKLDETARDLLDSSYPSIDKMYDAQHTAGIGSKEYMELYDIYREYNKMASDKDYKDESGMSVSEISRNMIVDFSKKVDNEKLDWVIDNFAIYTPIRANIKTPQKLVDNTSLNWEQSDKYLDGKSKLAPGGDHKGVTQNQVLMYIRDDKDLTETQKWELVEHDGDISDSAWSKLSPYMKKGYKGSDGTLEYALKHATWWRPTIFKGWKEMRYDVIYNSDYSIAK